MSIDLQRLNQIAYFKQRPWALLNAMGELIAHGILTETSHLALKRLQMAYENKQLAYENNQLGERGHLQGWYYISISGSSKTTFLVYDDEAVAQLAVSIFLEATLEVRQREKNPQEQFQGLVSGKNSFSESDDPLFFDFLQLLRTNKKITSLRAHAKSSNSTPESAGLAPMQLMVIQAQGLNEDLIANLLEALEYKVLSAYHLHRVVLVTRTEEHQEVIDLLRQMIQEELLLPLKTIEQVPLFSFKQVSTLVEDLSGALLVSVGLKPQQDKFLYKNLPLAMAIYQSSRTYEAREMEDHQAIAIGPVLEDPELIHTALVFFKSNLNVTDTANALYVHRNTLLYRLQKITQLTGYDLKNFEDAMNFSVVLGACSLVR